VGGPLIWSFGSFELDDERYELRHRGQVIALRRRVFDVLRYLVTNNDRLVSKEDLLQGVWSGETIHEAVVAQNIAILRRLLGDTRGSAKVIETVHGRGYRFVADVSAVPAKAAAEQAPASLFPGAPFVGRERVMQELRVLLDEALAGHGRIAVITGDPGVGKTRTADQLALEATARGARVLVGRCHEAEGAPAYWPWLQILRAAAGDDERAPSHARGGRDGSDVAHLLSELRGQFGDAPRPQPLDSAAARFRLFDAVTSLLSRLSSAQPLLLLLDDLHWADEASLHLLRFLAREVRTLPLLVLATCRDVAEQTDQAATLLSSLMGNTDAYRIRLEGLSQADTSELIAATLQRDLGPALLTELHALTEGNPFFVHEVMRLLTGDLTGLRADGRLELELPTRVREIIALRLRGLDADAQRLLSLASVVGRDFNLAVLQQVAGLARAEVLRLLEAASRLRIVREVTYSTAAEPTRAASGHYRFAHALIRESLYGALSGPERVQLHGQVGRALEALFGVDADEHLNELAHHFYQGASAGDVERAVSYCQRAGDQALDLLAFEQAVLQYRRGLEALACRLPIDEQRRFELKLALGSALFRAGQDGNPALIGAAEIARRLERPELIGRVVLSMCGWPRFGRRGRTANPALYPLLTEALAAPLEHDPALRAQLLSALALNCPHETPAAEQVALSREALTLARAVPHDEALYDALLARLRLMQAPEDTARRLGLASELLATAERLGQRERIFTAHELRVQPLLALSDLAAADQEIATCTELAEQLRLQRYSLQVARFALERALGDGRFGEIKALTQEAVRVRGHARASAGYMVNLFVWRTFERSFRGDRAWFEREIAGMAADMDKSVSLRSHVAYLYALFGRLDDARACYGPLVSEAALDRPRDDDWLWTLVLTADAVAGCGDVATARALYTRLLPHAALNVVHVEWFVYLGSCAHWLGVLGALLGEHVAAEAHFETALEMNASLGARPALARTSCEYARLLLRRAQEQGSATSRADAAHARVLLRDALAMAEELGMQGLAREARELAL
jgi:DNA-binding winged helix-turn-helix (wHTH) protein